MLAELPCGLELGDGFPQHRVGWRFRWSGAAGEEDPLGAAQDAPAVGGEFEAFAAPGAALGVGRGLLDEVAEADLAGGAAAGDPLPQLAGSVVGQPLVVAGAVVVLAVVAGDDAGVIDAAVLPGGEGRSVLAVVEAADDDGTVGVAFDEFDQDFAADARCPVRAPVGAGDALCDAHPGAGGFVAGGAIRFSSHW